MAYLYKKCFCLIAVIVELRLTHFNHGDGLWDTQYRMEKYNQLGISKFIHNNPPANTQKLYIRLLPKGHCDIQQTIWFTK